MTLSKSQKYRIKLLHSGKVPGSYYVKDRGLWKATEIRVARPDKFLGYYLCQVDSDEAVYLGIKTKRVVVSRPASYMTTTVGDGGNRESAECLGRLWK